MSTPLNTTLYFSEGSSDKEYRASLVPAAGGFMVTFLYGRRGGPLKGGEKTATPVPYDQALKIYNKLVAEKTGKGYTTGESGTPFQGTEKAGDVTGFQPQLLNEITEEQALALLDDDDWMLQEKMDGERRPVIAMAGEVIGVNKKGLATGLPQPIADAMKAYGDTEIDGEEVDGVLHVFDATKIKGRDISKNTYEHRLAAVCDLLRSTPACIKVVLTARTSSGKRAMFDSIKALNGEGVVFKRKNAPYTPGRPNSGGTQLKFKFRATATCEVIRVNGAKRSVGIAVYDNDKRTEVGNVTIAGDIPIPKVGAFIEVKYLYAYPGGSLFQPVYLGVRRDQDITDCGIGQLKYKAGTVEAAPQAPGRKAKP